MGLLDGVQILWVSSWHDGPVEGMAAYDGRDCWFRAVFDPELNGFPEPRRCRLLELADDQRSRQWARHRSWEEHAGGQSCYHDDAPEPVLRPEWWRYFDEFPDDAGQRVPTVCELGEFLVADDPRVMLRSVPVPVADGDVAERAARI